jgi:hypothetical protein
MLSVVTCTCDRFMRRVFFSTFVNTYIAVPQIVYLPVLDLMDRTLEVAELGSAKFYPCTSRRAAIIFSMTLQ